MSSLGLGLAQWSGRSSYHGSRSPTTEICFNVLALISILCTRDMAEKAKGPSSLANEWRRTRTGEGMTRYKCLVLCDDGVGLASNRA